MNKEKREIIIIGTLGSVLALLICALGIWLFSLETAETMHTYGIFGIPIKGKTLAAIVTWLGLVALFFSMRKMVKSLSQNPSS
jgi:hypothetical protein